MVRGIEKFREYFKDFPQSYVVIGGTACELVLGEAGLTARGTKDIDIILVIEALNKEFVTQFWNFIKAAKYQRNEQSEGERKYYRFLNPEAEDFPMQIELFSKVPDTLTVAEGVQLTPIPIDDDLSSLSAILMNEDYYAHTLANSSPQNEIMRANTEALICLKACAYLDLKRRKEEGEKIDEKNVRKHKNDVFRLALLLTAEGVHEIPTSIHNGLQNFMNTVKPDLPDKAFFKEVGAAGVEPDAVFSALIQKFGLNG
ncbi:MAG: hypothetical protein IM606_15760 [Cytophagales bacterium]|jgi:hypothetical protein|nr:hypothetical protein [Cytophagales bacterium]MCA6392566.1 hypothetical protein [Cytophagales bacterium]MCA6396639.1 hypothetical protein [Cytophagales bacterium]MCA6401662.1 hypothetical protein [Cytophagales bacterium]MCA6407295.1 hypothetical protein [Cytophagales bacterium]